MKQIIYSSPYVPAEWIAAHGFKPWRILPDAVTPSSAITRMEGLCPYVRAFMNSIIVHKKAGGAIMTTGCDQMRRGFELVDSAAKVQCFLMNVPKTWQNAAAKNLYIDEIKRLGCFLIELGGKSPSQDELSAIMLKFDIDRRILRDSIAHKKIEGVPLAIIGGPLMRNDICLFDIIKEFGGHVVLDGTETGERSICPSFDKKRIHTDPLGELANAYFAGIPDVSNRPNIRFYDWLQRGLKSRAVEGIILWRYIWCDLWHAELQRIRKITNLPVLEIDADGEKELSQRTKQRINSFLEVVSCGVSLKK